ncbi:S24 family peptidase [Cupriavidus necator]|uniref:S24 family peptidase n=1 Tax=Cupriavidus necator TaxID=106590 RepID=UPI00339D37C4
MENPNIPWPTIEGRLNALGKNQAWLASQLLTGTNTITNWKRRGGAPVARIADLARALDCTTDELISQHPTEVGSGPVSAPAYNPLTGTGDNFLPGPDIRGMIPLISWVQAGNWSDVVKAFTEEDAEEWLPALRAIGKRAFALRVEGQSMEPMFRHGEIIYVDPEVQAEHGKYVVVQLDDEPQATFKSLVIEGGQKFLRPLNPDWPGPKFLPINGNATIIGVVVGKWTPI